jgi:transposase
MRTRVKNKIRSLINGEGFLSPPEKLYTKAGRRWLEELDVVEEARLRISTLLRMLDHLDAEIKEMEKRLRNHYTKHPVWQEDVAILRSMPGIGLLTSLTILAELGDWRRFKRSPSVANFAGLVPRVDKSNKKCHYGRITKQGPRHLRWILSEAALVSIKYVPRYRELYDKVSENSPHGVGAAKVAVGRRMLEDAWIMLKKREPFKFEIRKTVKK